MQPWNGGVAELDSECCGSTGVRWGRSLQEREARAVSRGAGEDLSSRALVLPHLQ